LRLNRPIHASSMPSGPTRFLYYNMFHMPQGEQDREAASARHVTLTATQQEVLDRMERAVADIVFPFALDSLSMGVLVHELLPDLRQGDVGDIVDTFARDGVLKEQCVDFFRKEGVERGILLERVEQLQALPAEEVQQKGDAYIDWLRADGWPTKFQRQKLQGRLGSLPNSFSRNHPRSNCNHRLNSVV